MTAPSIAEATALGVRLGETLTGADLARAQANLSDVSAWAREEAEQEWPNAPAGVPAAVVVVVLTAARRMYENPEGFLYETMGPMSGSRAASTVTGGVFTEPELKILHRCRPRGGLWTLSTTRGDDDAETGFVSDSTPGSDPIAYVAAGDPGFDQADHYPGF
ncbi:hypothetical protein [Nocardia sp. NPDC057227]|uniref:hypothetical protein n=1 Tax=Nocardia sp. NPDC057227 TaxID=3346056 RepID=UPI00363C6A8F